MRKGEYADLFLIVLVDNENQIDLQTIDTILKYQKENKFIQEWIDQRREKLIQLFKRVRISLKVYENC